ncbi:hypothetical protein PM082_023363 [Marasmius tenuissimus]|nr:hypothetical protein PM082_023363 [Marasmius tenuissimus]
MIHHVRKHRRHTPPCPETIEVCEVSFRVLRETRPTFRATQFGRRHRELDRKETGARGAVIKTTLVIEVKERGWLDLEEPGTWTLRESMCRKPVPEIVNEKIYIYIQTRQSEQTNKANGKEDSEQDVIRTSDCPCRRANREDGANPSDGRHSQHTRCGRWKESSDRKGRARLGE